MDADFAWACSFDSPAPETTFEIAALLGRAIGTSGLAIGLIGPLGSGKTLFVKGLAAGLGLDPRIVSSPTFVLAQQYPLPEGPDALHHLDLYRLESEAELEAIGFLDLLGPRQVLAVEWLDRFPEVLGAERLVIEFLPPPSRRPAADAGDAAPPSSAGPVFDSGERHFRATAWGDEPTRVLRDWSERWSRLEREEAGAERGASGRSVAGGIVLTLLLTGVLAVRGVMSLQDSSPAGCAELEPVEAGFLSGEVERDALGARAVACGSPDSESRDRGAPIEGIAQLLDGARIDPNTASRALLENLPGIGPGRAEAIVGAREQRPFESTRALERVPGIGPRTLEQLEPFLAVDSEAPSG